MKMNLGFVFILFLFTSFKSEDPVTWKYTVKKLSLKTYEVCLTARIDEGWHIYSQQSPRAGPIPTKIIFGKNPIVALQNNAIERGDIVSYFDEIFKVNVLSYQNKVDFIQLIKLQADVKTEISGTILYMACTDYECLPPKTISFNLKL